ncbi:hypothetical protein GGI25_005144 [Coemansia spiralis]|uniref:Uncharacterized protein n=2 Tax=Coemansia TaxID=4863 RepID=A0A9W8G3S1_9FUNG|nr:hypothetical protein EDC05_005075 [Coemansia umbellata]KAJ2620039.1 hypothetical protein GGI26_005333 [Coemansia sp. RSA 1358]KAJ2672382.1 hypothetical protein GGI25_005144 [Coemansia spiralis]
MSTTPNNSASINDLLASLGIQDEWSFVVSDQWVVTIQSLAVVSLISSLGVLAFMSYILLRHRKYLERLSLRISAYVAIADILNSVAQVLMLQNDYMVRQSPSTLRFILWLAMFSTLAFVFFTLSISIQLHLSTLTRVRIGTYMWMEKFYVPGSIVLAAVLPGIAVSMMEGMFWIPYMHSFNWPTEGWKRKLVLWMCNYMWIILTIVYCTVVAALLSVRIWVMWRNSEVIEAPRMPEKWDWSRLTDSARPSADTVSPGSLMASESDGCTVVSQRVSFERQQSSTQGSMAGGRGYLMTVMRADKQTGQAMAVRSYVDKKRFLRSIQRLACYPLVPVITQLGTVAMNMVDTPTKSLYIYGTTMATTSGLLNLVVFLLNPALPDIWKDAALGQTL